LTTQKGELPKKEQKMTEKLDLRKELKALYSASAKKVEVLDVPVFQFAMVDGQIEEGKMPGTSPDFQEAMEALYGVSYTLKFICKLRKNDPVDYPVMVLEGLWWVPGREFSFESKDPWAYTVMILQPPVITLDLFAEALSQMRQKKGDRPGFGRLRLEAFQEGLSVQILHVGPYATEQVTVAKMDAFARENGYQMHGKHHEIYLGNPLRAQPEKLKTILRHPVMK
jgi:hypothetical protein